MPLTEPSERRLRPVRLTDVPTHIRIQAARTLLRHAHDDQEAQAILAAAMAPSSTVYFVTPDALRAIPA